MEWRHTVETSRLLRVASLVALGAVGSVLVLVVAGVAGLVVALVLAGEFGVLAVIAAAAVLFGRRILFYGVLASQTDGGFVDPFSRLELLAASVAWAVAFVALALLNVPVEALLGCFALAVFGILPVVALLSSEGEVDTSVGELRVGDRDVALGAIERVARRDLGPVSVFRICYHEGTGGSAAPRFLGVAAEDAARVGSALKSEGHEPPEPTGSSAVQKTLYAFGLGALGVATVLGYSAVHEGGDATVMVGYAAGIAVLFGVMFLWLGAVER